MDANQKTPGQVAYEAWKQFRNCSEPRAWEDFTPTGWNAWEMVAQRVLSHAQGQTSGMTDEERMKASTGEV